MDLRLIGRITRAHGIAGAVVVQPYTDVPGRFGLLKAVFIGTDEESVRPLSVQSARESSGHVILVLEGVTTRSGAEELRGQQLFIDVRDTVAPPEGRYLIDDLLRCEVVTEDGARVGRMKDVWLMPSQDLYVIDAGGREILVPAVPAFIVSVDTAACRITIRPVPGLLEDMDED